MLNAGLPPSVSGENRMNRIHAITVAVLGSALFASTAAAGYENAGECSDAVVKSCEKYNTQAGKDACVKSGVAQCIKAFPEPKGSSRPAAPSRLIAAPQPPPRSLSPISRLSAGQRPARDCSATAQCENGSVSCSVKGSGVCQAQNGHGVVCQSIKADGTADDPAEATCP
jgi:hypothetical protein